METFQKEMNGHRAESRWDLWSQHRKQVSALFEHAFSKCLSVNQIAIFGAGNCDDLDLEKLAMRCQSIHLFDIDLESMEKGVEKLSSETREKIRLVKLDVTGLDRIHIEEELTRLFVNRAEASEITAYLKMAEGKTAKLSAEVFAEYQSRFDIVATSAIYTQLFYNWGLAVLEKHRSYYQDDELGDIKDSLLDLRDRIIMELQDSLFFCCTKNGFYITWTDALQMDESYREIMNKGVNAVFGLASEVGFGAALLAIQSFMGKVDKSDFYLKYWVWDFNEVKQYLTFGLLGKKRQGGI